MSIPTIFSTANCQNSSYWSLGGGAMVSFCQTYKQHVGVYDYCWINTQEDYNTWQLGCVNSFKGTFVDENNNTVTVERKPGYDSYLKNPIEFPVGSHDNYYVLPAPHYDPPYPIFITQENCINTPTSFVHCCRGRPTWSTIETVAPNGTCAVIDDEGLEYFASCCVDKAQGTYINPLDGSTTTPEIPNTFTGLAPPYSEDTREPNTSMTGDFWTESEYLATHTDEPYPTYTYSYERSCPAYAYNESSSWDTCIPDEDNEEDDSTDGLDSYTYVAVTSFTSENVNDYSSSAFSSPDYTTDSYTYSYSYGSSDLATSSYPSSSYQFTNTDSSLLTSYSVGTYF